MSKTTINKLQIQKENGEKITMLTAYSCATANILAECDVDVILVGDSLGMVFQGKENTLAVTIDEMIYHARAVRQGAPQAFVVVDMPFMSYQVNPEETLVNAGRIIKEANANAVKLEGVNEIIGESIKKILAAGIPVMGHLGFTPQAVNCLSGYRVQGRDEASADQLLADAKKLAKLGVFSIVLEMVPAELAAVITKELKIPIIGCGAGVACDGQVLVLDDLLGMYPKKPKFAKQYADIRGQIAGAVGKYIREVQEVKFPDQEHSF